MGSNPTFGTIRALVAQWIERSPAEAEAVGSSPTERAILLLEAQNISEMESASGGEAETVGSGGRTPIRASPTERAI